MELRKIEKILSPANFMWVGDAFYTSSFIGGEITRRRMDPFFALGYNADLEFEATEIPRGVGAHPHKGFETVTLAYKGKVEHWDSRGNHGIIGTGDVQWMTAGRGILHKEYHEKEFAQQGGVFQMVQLWVNLPAKDKETEPKYQDLLASDSTKVQLDNNGGYVDVFSGEFKGAKGKGTTFSPIHLYNAYFNQNGETDFSFPKHYNTSILILDGHIEINGETKVEKDHFILFENDKAENFHIKALSAETKVLIMSGEPLNEPIVHYGPFVMNTEAQIEQAFEEYRAGKFGEL